MLLFRVKCNKYAIRSYAIYTVQLVSQCESAKINKDISQGQCVLHNKRKAANSYEMALEKPQSDDHMRQ